MTDKERQGVFELALQQENGFLRKQDEDNRERGGYLFEAVKANILRAYLKEPEVA